MNGESTDKLPLSVAPLGRQIPMLGAYDVFQKAKVLRNFKYVWVELKGAAKFPMDFERNVGVKS